MSRDPHANVGMIKNLDRGCRLPLRQESHCEQDFGAHHAIDGIMNYHMDFFCSMFHTEAYPWLLGTKIEKYNISGISFYPKISTFKVLEIIILYLLNQRIQSNFLVLIPKESAWLL